MCAARLARYWSYLRAVQTGSSGLRRCIRYSTVVSPVKTTSAVGVHATRRYSQSFVNLEDEYVDEIPLSDATKESSGPSFSSFPLSQEVLQRLDELGFKEPFEIQEKTLPHTLNGIDVIGRAVTGSGKTLAYALPIIHTLSQSPPGPDPRALVITPTRELCNQVHKSIQSLNSNIRCVALYGGTSYFEQEKAMERGVDVVCATPGRLNDHLVKRQSFGLHKVKFLILDEADELLTPQFRVQIENVMQDVPRDKQMMLFSATMPPNIKSLTNMYMKDPVIVDLTSNRSLVPEKIVHQYITTFPTNKLNLIPDLLLLEQPRRALVFTPTKVQTHVVASQLTNFGFKAAALNSDMSQQSRDACFSSFKAGMIEVLVATDVAARGLDVPEIDLVLQVDIPPSGVDFYIHRSGRTGRKGQPGKTILVTSRRSRTGPDLNSFLMDLEDAGIPISPMRLPSPTAIASTMLNRVKGELDPEKMHPGAMEVALSCAKELIDKHGAEEALAAAIVAYSNLDSKFKSDEENRRTTDNRSEDDMWRQERRFGGGRRREDNYGRGGFGQRGDRRSRDRWGQDQRFGGGQNRDGGRGRRGGYGYTQEERFSQISKSTPRSKWDTVGGYTAMDASYEDDLDNNFSWDQHK